MIRSIASAAADLTNKEANLLKSKSNFFFNYKKR